MGYTVENNGSSIGSVTTRGGAKGSTAAGDVTSTAASADRQPLDVTLRDTSGAPVAVGGGTQYTEDVAATADPIGTMGMAVRADTLGAVTSTDGDNIAVRATNKGELYVKQTDAVPITDNAGSITVDGTITANAGTGTMAVSLASVPSHAVTNAGTFAVQNNAATPAGTNNIGDVDVLTLPAIPAGNNNIGDVDVATLPVAFNTGVRSATTQRVTVATDDLVPVTGTVTANAGTGTQAVSLASVPSHAVTNAGTFAVQNTAATPAGTNNIGDVDVLTMPAITGTVTANAGTNLNTSALALDATLTGGTAKAIARGAAKGSTTAGDITSTAASADRQPLDVTLRDTSGAPVAVGGGTQYTEDVAAATDPIGTMGIAVRQDTLSASTVSADGDNIALRATNKGELYVKQTDPLPAGTNNIGDVDVLTLPVAFNTGTRSATTQRVTIATDDVVPASQSGTWNVTNVSGTVSLPTGAATSANQSTEITALQLIDDVVFTDDAAFTVGTSKVNSVGLMADETATDSVDEGDIGIARMTLDRKQITAAYAHTAGGATPYKLISAASTNATSVKGSGGTVYNITASNVNAAVRYLKLYNKASAPTVGTDTPVQVYAIPGNTAGAGTNIPIGLPGLAFGTGIALAITTGAADSDTGAVAANEIIVNLGYA